MFLYFTGQCGVCFHTFEGNENGSGTSLVVCEARDLEKGKMEKRQFSMGKETPCGAQKLALRPQSSRQAGVIG